jgi:hypothetical protein
MRVGLKDGTMVGGVYGGNSYVDDENEQDIYLQEVYNLNIDGNFLETIENNAGIWIPDDVISCVVFFKRDKAEVISDGG